MGDRVDPKIDMALDDVIMSGGRGHGRGGRGHRSDRHERNDRHERTSEHRGVRKPSARRIEGGRISVDARAVGRPLVSTSGPMAGEDPIRSSLSVANLHHEVSEDDLKELFGTVGRVISVRMEYDRSGRSNGQATVHFGGRQDAILASDRFHNIPLDGLPMRIQITAVPQRHTAAAAGGGREARQERWDHAGFEAQQDERKRGMPRRGRGGRGRGDKPRGDRRDKTGGPVSAAMLDNDLDAYMMDRTT